MPDVLRWLPPRAAEEMLVPKLTARERPVLAFICLIALALLLAISLVPVLGGPPARAEEPTTSQAESPGETPPQEEQPCQTSDSAGDELPTGSLTISGMVTDGAVGIGDIRVRISMPGVGSADVTTGPTGGYALDGLGDGTYYVSFFDQSGAFQNGFWTVSGLVLTAEEAGPVELAGSSATADVELPAEQLFAISGSVSNSDTALVPGVKLTATSPYFPLAGCDTSADGTYTMAVRVGAYRVEVEDPSRLYPNGYYAAGELGNFSTDIADATLVEVETADAMGINIEFPEVFSLSGAVTIDGSTGIGGILLSACGTAEEGCHFGSTDGGGGFTIFGLVAGSYTIAETGGDYGYLNGYYAGDGQFDVDAADAAVVPVADDVAGLNLRVVLAPTAEGLVTNDDDVGVGGISVTLSSEDSGSASATTNEDGTFTTTGLQPGTYTMAVSDANASPFYPSGYLGTSGSFVIDPGDAIQIVVDLDDLSNLSDLDIELVDGGSAEVSVVRAGEGVEFANVSVCSGEFQCEATGSTAFGGLVTLSALYPGSYYIQATTDFEHFYWRISDTEVTEVFSEATTVPISANATQSVPMVLPGPGTDTPPCEGAECQPIPLDDGTGATPVELTFENVETGGTTSLTIPSEEPTIPGGFAFGDPPTYYEITTTATLAEGSSYTICVTFDPLAFENPAGVRLYHFVSEPSPGAWEDTTLLGYPLNGVVCGEADSFSPFALIERDLAFAGFFGVKAAPHVNGARAGDLIGIQFGLGGDVGLTIFAAGSPSVERVDCVTHVAIGPSAPAAGGSPALKYNAKTGRYTFQWKTDKAWRNTCQRLLLTFRDESSAEVLFQFRR